MGIDLEDGFWVRCMGCGEVYTLLLATVCPKCWKWPTRDGSDRINQKAEEFRKGGRFMLPTNPNPSPENVGGENHDKPLKMFVWDGRGKYKVCVCAGNVSEARTLALEEMSLRGDLLNMREHVEQEQPLIYHRPNAELALTENGETEELNICLEAETERRQAAEAELAALKAQPDGWIAELRQQVQQVVEEYRDFQGQNDPAVSTGMTRFWGAERVAAIVLRLLPTPSVQGEARMSRYGSDNTCMTCGKRIEEDALQCKRCWRERRELAKAVQEKP